MFKKIRFAVDVVLFIWMLIRAIQGLAVIARDIIKYIKTRREK